MILSREGRVGTAWTDVGPPPVLPAHLCGRADCSNVCRGYCRRVRTDGGSESTLWKIHGERLVDDTRRLRLSIASVELPDGVQFEQYVLRMPKAAMMVVLDDAREHALMMWRHRFIIGRWVWEL